MPVQTIQPHQRRIGDYAAVVDPATLADLRQLARPLAGLRVLHLSTSPFGSAVADTLASLVPLQRDLGISSDWRVVRGETARVWSGLYEALNGIGRRWRHANLRTWFDDSAALGAEVFDRPYDIVIAHDPQAIGLAQALPRAAGRPIWIWHCHLDTQAARPEVWSDVKRALAPFRAVLFPGPDLVRDDLPVAIRLVVRPAIDPRAPRNEPLPDSLVPAILTRLGLDPNRPLVGQFAPIDQRYAPVAALGAYWLARREIPGLQIVLVDRSLGPVDPARRDLKRVLEAAEEDPDIHVIQGNVGLGVTEYNVLQRRLLAVVQMAVPRGFGWGVAEAQWKNRPAIVGNHGQLPEQVERGAAGLVVESAADAAEAIVRLHQDSQRAADLGRLGHDLVQRKYLITRLAGDYLSLFHRLLAETDRLAGGSAPDEASATDLDSGRIGLVARTGLFAKKAREGRCKPSRAAG